MGPVRISKKDNQRGRRAGATRFLSLEHEGGGEGEEREEKDRWGKGAGEGVR